MKKVDYNIEFGHIFADQKISLHQRESSKIAEEKIKKLGNKSFVTCILIDDYQPSYSYLDIYEFLKKMKDLEVPPTYIIYQSELLSLANKLIHIIKKKNIKTKKDEIKVKSDKDTLLLNNQNISSISLKDEYFVKINNYIETPALIAAWYLLRLGIFNKEEIIKQTKYTEEKPFAGKKIITIIPKKYKQIDETAKIIISNTKYKSVLKNIENIYF